MFSDNASISGSVNGSDAANNNKENFSAYQSPITVILTALTSGGAKYNSVNSITSFSNIGDIVGNFANARQNILTGPADLVFTYTAPGIGYIDDPTYFYGFNLVDPADTSSSIPPSQVSPIVQQSMLMTIDVQHNVTPTDIYWDEQGFATQTTQCMQYEEWRKFSGCFVLEASANAGTM